MKFINPYGQLVSISVTLKNLFGEHRRCIEVSLNGQEVLVVDEKGNTIIASGAQKFSLDHSTYEKVCNAIDGFLERSLIRRSRAA